jgi:hypothetical protein
MNIRTRKPGNCAVGRGIRLAGDDSDETEEPMILYIYDLCPENGVNSWERDPWTLGAYYQLLSL